MEHLNYKHCAKCDNVYPKNSGFYVSSKRIDGVSVYCRACQKALLGQHKMRTYREQIVELLGGKCVECGYDKDIRALQIDHVNGGGKLDRKTFKSPQQFYAFVTKCTTGLYQVLCANCNVIKRHTHAQWGMKSEPMPAPIMGKMREIVIANKRKRGKCVSKR